jgi:hypothetical protein
MSDDPRIQQKRAELDAIISRASENARAAEAEDPNSAIAIHTRGYLDGLYAALAIFMKL